MSLPISVHTCHHCNHIILDLSDDAALQHDQIFVLANTRQAEKVAAKSGCLIFNFTTYNAYASAETENDFDKVDNDYASEYDEETQYQGFRLVLRFRRGWQAAPVGAITSYWTNNAENSWDPDVRSIPQPRTQYVILPAQADQVSSIIKRRMPQPDVSSPASLQMMENWIHNCDSNHGCRLTGNHSWIPTRLIEVSKDQGLLSARVVATAGSSDIRYAVLSYAWGKTGALHRYLQNHSAEIENTGVVPLEDLPRTVMDAINVTFSLGVQYLWVDCLCILQNDPQDKTREIGFMAKIFESAYIGILAASSDASDKGFLELRKLRKDMQQCTSLRVKLPNDESGHAHLFTPEYSYAPKQEPLSRRAWTLQESLLTKRKLIFNSRTVTWSCQELARDEAWNLWQEERQIGLGLAASGHTGVSAAMEGGFYEHTLASMITIDGDATSKDRAFHDLWEAVVIEYTNRDLFEIDDRPAAVSGIVERLSHTTGDTYLAGLWKSQLPQALFWVSHPSDSSTSKGYEHERLRGPTWSWMTVDARIRAVYHTSYLSNIETLVEVLKTEIEPLSSDVPYGASKSGNITLTGYIEEMYCVVLLFIQKGYRWYDMDGYTRDIDFHSDFLISDIRDVIYGVTIPIPHETNSTEVVDTDAEESQEEAEYYDSDSPISQEHSASEDRDLALQYGIKVSLLYLFKSSSDDKTQSFCDGLVVLQTETGAYRRIGTFSNRFVPMVDEVSHQPLENLGLQKIVLV